MENTDYSLGSDMETMVDTGWSDIRCQPCTIHNKSTVATLFCEGCNEYLCQDCSKGHVIYSVTRSHILVPAEAARNKSPIVDLKGLDHCDQHKKALKFFCKDEKRICCSTCAIVVHRKCKDVIEIGAVPVEEVNQKCLTVKEELVELKERNSSTIGYLKTEVKGIDKQNDELAKELDSMRIKIIQHFDEFAANMLQESRTIQNKKIREFEILSSKCSSLDTLLSLDINLCSNVEQRGTSVQKYIIQHRLQENLKDYLNTTLQLESNIVTTDIMLVYEDRLKLLANSTSTLGSLKVSECTNRLQAQKALDESEQCAGHGWSSSSRFGMDTQTCQGSNSYHHLLSQNNTGEVSDALGDEKVFDKEDIGQNQTENIQHVFHEQQQQQVPENQLQQQKKSSAQKTQTLKTSQSLQSQNPKQLLSPQSAVHSTLPSVPHSTPQLVPYSTPQSMLTSTLQSVPHSTPQSACYSTPQSIPTFSPQSVPHSTPQSVPRSHSLKQPLHATQKVSYSVLHHQQQQGLRAQQPKTNVYNQFYSPMQHNCQIPMGQSTAALNEQQQQLVGSGAAGIRSLPYVQTDSLAGLTEEEINLELQRQEQQIEMNK